MKKLLKNLLIATLLIALAGCGGSNTPKIDLDGIEALNEKKGRLDEADYDFLLDQFEAIGTKYAGMTLEERKAAVKENDKEAEMLVSISLMLNFQEIRLNDQQRARRRELHEKFQSLFK